MENKITYILNSLKKYKQIELLSDLLKKGGILFIIISLFLLLWLAFDNGLHLSMEWRIIAFALLTLSLIPPVKSFRKTILQTLKNDNLALRLERNNQHHENRIVNALCYSQKTPSCLSPLEKEIIAESCTLLSTFTLFHNFKKIFRFKNILIIILLFASLFSYLFLAPDFFINGTLRLLLPVFPIPPLTRVVLEGDLKDSEVAPGENVKIHFRISKGMAAFTRLLITKEEGTSPQELIVFPDAKGEYHHTFSNIRKSFEWKLKASDYQTRSYQVKLLNPPQIVDSTLHILPPFYIRNPFASGPLQTTHAIPEKSSVKIELELDSDIQNLTLINILKPEELAFKKLNDKQWEIVFPLTETKIFKIFFKSTTHDFKPLDTLYHLNIIKDTPPSLRLLSPQMILLEPEHLKTELSFIAEDDYGIHAYELQYKQENDKEWKTFETKEIEERNTLEKYWLLHLEKLNYAPPSPLYFRIAVEDRSPSKIFSPIIRINPMSGFDFRLNIFRQFLETHYQLARFVTSAFLSEAWDSNILEEIRNLLRQILTLRQKNYRQSIPSIELFLPVEKIENLMELSSKKNMNKIQKDRFKEELITFSSKFMKENTQLLNILLKKNLQDFQKEILIHKNSNLSPQKQQKLKSLSVYWNQFTRSLQENRESFHQMHFKNLYTIFDRFIKAAEKTEIAQRCTLLDKALSLKEDENILNAYKKLYNEVDLFMNSFYMKGHQKVEGDEKRIQLEIRLLTEEMKKTLALLNAINLRMQHEPSDFELMISSIFSLINKFREKISEFQDQYPQLGIKGLTILNEVQFDLKETKSWYINDNIFKSEIKMKKAIENLALCIQMLTPLFQSLESQKTPAFEAAGEETALTPLKPAVFLFKPDPLTFTTSETTLEIEGTATAPHSISEILLEASIFDPNHIKQVSFQKTILSPVHLPQKSDFKYSLDLSVYPLKDKSRMEFKIICKEESGSEILTGESLPCQILINNTPPALHSAEIAGLKTPIEQAWRLLTESQKKAVELFNAYEKEWLNPNTKALLPLAEQICILETMILNKLSALETTLKQLQQTASKGTDARMISQISTLRLEVSREINALILSLNQQSLLLSAPSTDTALFNSALIRSKAHIQNALQILQSLVLEGTASSPFSDSVKWVEESLQKFRNIAHEKNFTPLDSLIRQSFELLDSLKAKSENNSSGLKINLTPFIARWKKNLQPEVLTTKEEFSAKMDLLTQELSLLTEASLRSEIRSTLHHQSEGLTSTKNIADLYAQLQKADFSPPVKTLINSLLDPDTEPSKKDPEILKKQIRSLLTEEKDLPLQEQMNLMADKLEILNSRYEKLSKTNLELKDILYFNKLNDTLSFLENQSDLFSANDSFSDPSLMEMKNQISVRFQKIRTMQQAIDQKVSSGIEAFIAEHKLIAAEQFQSFLNSSETVQTEAAYSIEFQKKYADLQGWFESFEALDPSATSLSEQLSAFFDLLKKIIPFIQLIPDKNKCKSLFETSQRLHESFFFFQKALFPPKPFLQNLKQRAEGAFLEFHRLINAFFDQEISTAFEQNKRQLLSGLDTDIKSLQNDKRNLIKKISELEKQALPDADKKEELTTLNTSLASVDEKLQQLDQHKTSLHHSEEIQVTITPRDKEGLPEETRLVLNKTDQSLQEIESALSGKQEALNSRILKTLSFELEAMEEEIPVTAEKNRINPLKDYALSLLGNPDIKDIGSKLNEAAEKEAAISQKKSLSGIISQLKEATDSLDRLRIDENKPLQKEHYLSFLNQGVSRLTELSNSLKASQQVSSYFKQMVNQSLGFLKNYYQESLHNALNGEEWKEQILKTGAPAADISKDLYAHMDSALLRYYHLNLPAKDKKSLEHSTRYDHPYPGYEVLIRDYLISIADSNKD